MKGCQLVACALFTTLLVTVCKGANPPPVTQLFDPSLRFASADLPIDQAPLLSTVTGNQPEGVHLSSLGPTGVIVQWYTGKGQTTTGATTPLNAASVPSVVNYGTSSSLGSSATGNATTFDQIYFSANYQAWLLNYTSPVIHTVKLTGLAPQTTYFYTVGDGVSLTSAQYNFTTPAAVGTYPQRFVVFGDMGQTYNSSSTLSHLLASAQAKNNTQVLFTGDFSYADQYAANGSFRLNTSGSAGKGTPSLSFVTATFPSTTFQPRNDAWTRFLEPLLSHYPWLPTFGNHEIEVQSNGKFFVGPPIRFTTPYVESKSGNPTWYSVEISGVHIIVLNNYLAYNSTSPQTTWLKADLASVDRTKTPFLMVMIHAPWYNTYVTHYKEAECVRQAGWEQLFYNNGVNLVMHGHVHAYERINPVFNYTTDPCAPAYVTIGDAGNAEGTYAFFADQAGQCPAVPVNGTSYQPDQFGVGIGSVGTPIACPSFLDGGANGGYCPTSQPSYSAYREPSFGHATLDLLNATTAYWQWHRNQDGVAVTTDKAYLTLNPSACPNQAGSKVSSFG